VKRNGLRICIEALALLGVALAAGGVWGLSGGQPSGAVASGPAVDATASDALAVSAAAVAAWGDRVMWVDARSAEAYAAEHVPGALHLNEEAWDDGLLGLMEGVVPGVRVVVYCGSASCGTSRAVARRLRRDLGMDAVFALAGGWDGLMGEGLP